MQHQVAPLIQRLGGTLHPGFDSRSLAYVTGPDRPVVAIHSENGSLTFVILHDPQDPLGIARNSVDERRVDSTIRLAGRSYGTYIHLPLVSILTRPEQRQRFEGAMLAVLMESLSWAKMPLIKHFQADTAQGPKTGPAIRIYREDNRLVFLADESLFSGATTIVRLEDTIEKTLDGTSARLAGNCLHVTISANRGQVEDEVLELLHQHFGWIRQPVLITLTLSK